MDGSLKFIVIETKEQGLFISDNIKGDNYFNSKIPNLFFDGLKLVTTFKSGWYKLPNMPKKVEKKGTDASINRRYELKAGFPVSDLTPQIILSEDWDDDSDIRGLYSYKYDVIEGKLEAVDFEIEVLSEEENFYIEKPKYPATPSLITSLTAHPSLHSERPCSISGKELYKILRSYLKLNINPKYARISSDYNFCLSVEKVISHEPESYTVDVGKRKPKYETRYRKQRTIKVFETSPEGYSSYPTQKPISAKNQKELEEKIDVYLEEVLNEINKPLIQCTCCNGMGVILE